MLPLWLLFPAAGVGAVVLAAGWVRRVVLAMAAR